MSTEHQYFQRLMALSPQDQSEDMLLMRQRFLGYPLSQPKTSSIKSLRYSANQLLDEWREFFWEPEAREIEAELDQLDLSHFPDLLDYALRLKCVRTVIHAFDEAQDDPKLEPTFVAFLKRLMVAPRTQIGEGKALFFYNLRERKQFRLAKKQIKHLKKKHQEIYFLEKHWFDKILASKRSVYSEDRESLFWGIFILLMIQTCRTVF